MKKQFRLTIVHVLSILGTFVLSFLLSQGAFAEASFEVMCRSKAKEIAAETYKGCMTEYRQTQLEQIRKEYKEELSQLKNQYDKKLKKLSGKSAAPVATAPQSSVGSVNSEESEGSRNAAVEPTVVSTIQLKRTHQRNSGARMPSKKLGAGTQVIDLSKSVDSQLNSNLDVAESARREKKDASESNEVEIVELPVQE